MENLSLELRPHGEASFSPRQEPETPPEQPSHYTPAPSSLAQTFEDIALEMIHFMRDDVAAVFSKASKSQLDRIGQLLGARASRAFADMSVIANRYADEEMEALQSE